MPIYEYRCPKCGKKSSRVWLKIPSTGEAISLRCRVCGGGKLERVLSRFSNPKSEEKRLESLADGSSLAGLDEKDPRSMARLMRKMSEETGEPLEGEEVEMLEKMEAGEMPDDPAGEEQGARGGDDEFI
jgi:putative FmdB family regulatory protein